MRKKYVFLLAMVASSLLWARGANDASFKQDNLIPDQKGGLISAQKAKELMNKDSSVILIDVRTKEEYDEGRIPGALLLPYDRITEKTASEIIQKKDSVIILYCRSGRRSAIAADTLRALGYTTIFDMGGIGSWPYGLE
ncbi:MAG TPA: rhodanese-like domain-containing protein [Treponemataceae bacterium]|jgi:rhodanese-related sulfurtransferase|nr:rhodanese-like domain-containing protein [Treponemataceae bacterium]